MFKIIMLSTKKASLSTTEFTRLWRLHSQKVEDFKEVLRIQRYCKTVPLTGGNQLSTQRETLPFKFDAMGELCYGCKDDFLRTRDSEEGRRVLAILKEDEKRFVDLSNSVMWLGEEEQVL